MFASQLHIPPWELDRLTVAQFYAAIESFKEQQAEQAKQEAALEKLKKK